MLGIFKKSGNKEEFTPQAKAMWEKIPADFQKKVLQSVFCVKCLKGVEIVNYGGAVKDGLLVLDGKCKTCGHKVSRVVD